MSAPTDSPARNTRQHARIEQRAQQLRAQYPLQLLPTLSDSDRKTNTVAYEKQLRTAAASDSTWELACLASASICEDEWGHQEYIRKHYLRHLHCVTNCYTICKSCRVAYPLPDVPPGEESEGESESEHERIEMEFNRD
jgi:hypothetical protein